MEDKFECNIQIFGDNDLVAEKIKEASRKELISFTNMYFNPLFNFITKHADVIKVENLGDDPKKWKDRRMILNAYCSVDKNKVKALRGVVEKIDKAKYFSVMLTGPRTTPIFTGGKK